MEISLGNFINKKRIEKQISQRELASICGLGNSTISRIEKDEVIPETATLIKITEALGLDYSDIIPYIYENKDKSFVVDSVQTFLKKYQYETVYDCPEEVIEIAKDIQKLTKSQQKLIKQMIKQLSGKGEDE